MLGPRVAGLAIVALLVAGCGSGSTASPTATSVTKHEQVDRPAILIAAHGRGPQTLAVFAPPSPIWGIGWAFACGPQPWIFSVHDPAGRAFPLPDGHGLSRGSGYLPVANLHYRGIIGLKVLAAHGCRWRLLIERKLQRVPALPSAPVTPVPTITDLQHPTGPEVVMEFGYGGTSVTPGFFTGGKRWRLRWSFDCSRPGTGSFAVYLHGQRGKQLGLLVDKAGRRGSGKYGPHRAGGYFFYVVSACDWDLKVTN